MRKRVLVTASLFLLFGLIVFLNDASRALFTERTGNTTGEDAQLAPEETGSLKGLSGAGQERKAIKPGFVDQGRRWVPGSGELRKSIDSQFVPAQKNMTLQSLGMLGLAQTREMLSPYTRSLQVRAIQAGIPPHQAARLSAEAAEVATRAQLAGVPPAEAARTARLFGEKALSSSVKKQERLSFMTGAGTATVGGRAQPAGRSREEFVSRIQVLRRQQRLQVEEQTVQPQE